MLDWCESVCLGPGRLTTLMETDTHLLKELERRGYHDDPQGRFFVHLQRSLDDLPAPVVPDGYALRPVRGPAEAAARAAVHRAAFSRPDAPSQVTAEGYARMMRHWPYRAGLDWIVEAPDGSPAAFCLAWLDERDPEVVVEPVGTDPRHRRRGLATAAITAALHSARALGIRTARIGARGDDEYPAPRAVYAAMDFHPATRTRTLLI